MQQLLIHCAKLLQMMSICDEQWLEMEISQHSSNEMLL